MLDFPEMNWLTSSPEPEQHSLLPMFPAHWPRPLQRLGTLATLFENEISPRTPSPRIIIPLAALVNTLCRIYLISSWIVPHPSLSGAPSLTLLLLFFTSGPDLGA